MVRGPWGAATSVAAASALVLVAGTGTAWATPARGSELVRPAAGAPRPGAAGGGEHADAYANQGVLPYGDARFAGSPTSGPPLSAPVVGMAADPGSAGYWLVAADGGVMSYGGAPFHGSAGGIDLQAPVVGMAPVGGDGGAGYWLVALDGGVFSYGNARFFGSTGSMHLNEPIVGMASTPDGGGYWLVASDGGIFAFGDATFYGSTGSLHLNAPIVGMAATPSGHGYWLVAADGGVFTFGDATFLGSLGGQPINAWISGMAASPTGRGYTMAGADGTVYTFGDAVAHGDDSAASPTPPIAGIAATPDGGGYWLLEPDAFPTGFSHPGGGGAVTAAAASQIEGNPDQGQGPFCNAYGPCEAWCALFATWAWESGGIPIPRYAFTGDIYGWAAANTAVAPASAGAHPGDLVLYGTGPQSTATSVHTGVVAQVWPDGAVVTIEGDSGPGPYGQYNVTINGPFLPTDSATYNGVPIYAIARA